MLQQYHFIVSVKAGVAKASAYRTIEKILPGM
jgi:hypothetical protein